MLDLSRIFFTVFCFGSFIILVLITYRRGAEQGYDEVARNIVDDDDMPILAETQREETGTDQPHVNGADK